jgi:hypothetical protein
MRWSKAYPAGGCFNSFLLPSNTLALLAGLPLFLCGNVQVAEEEGTHTPEQANVATRFAGGGEKSFEAAHFNPDVTCCTSENGILAFIIHTVLLVHCFASSSKLAGLAAGVQ